MAIFAHAKENQVQYRLAIGAERCQPAQLGLGVGGGDGRRRFSRNTVDLGLRDPQRLEQELLSQTEIAFGVLSRHATLVAPEEMNPVQQQRIRDAGKRMPAQGGYRREEPPRNPPSRKGHAIPLCPVAALP